MCASAPARALRSSRVPASTTRGVFAAARAEGIAPVRNWTVVPTRSETSRCAASLSGPSGKPSRISFAFLKPGLPVVRAVQLDLHAVEDVRLRTGQPRLEAGRVVGGIDACRQRDDVDVEPLADGELHPAEGRRLPGGVAVEREPQPLRQPPELAQLLLGERRAHARDDRLEPGLAERDHVGVSLDDARAVLLRDRGPRLVEAVDDGALVEELRLLRVHVLAAQRIVVVELARLEADHAAACVGEREHEPTLEVVLAARPHQPGGEQLVPGEPLRERLAGERVAAERQAEPELARDRLREVAALQVVASERADLRLPESALVVRRGVVEQLLEAGTAVALRRLLRRDVLVLELHAEALREPLDRAGEIEPLRLLGRT